MFVSRADCRTYQSYRVEVPFDSGLASMRVVGIERSSEISKQNTFCLGMLFSVSSVFETR